MTDYNLENRCSLPAILEGLGAQEELNNLQQQFKKGDKSALMVAIILCANCKIIMPDWVDMELGSLDSKLNSDFKLTLDEYFGLKRKISNKAVFKKEKTARDNERDILKLLINHRVNIEGLNKGTGSFNTENLKDIASKSSFSFGEIDVVYQKHKQWLTDMDVDSLKKVEAKLLFAPGLISFTKTVPAPVPSVFHNSDPLARFSPEK